MNQMSKLTEVVLFIQNPCFSSVQVLPDKRTLKLLKSQSINVNWYMYCPETAVLLLSTTVQGNVLQPFAFKVSLVFVFVILRCARVLHLQI